MTVPDIGQSVAVHVQRSQSSQSREGVGGDLTDGVSGQSEMHQTGHVQEVFPPDSREKVVRQPELYGLAVDGGWDEQESGLGTQQGESGRDGLADTATGAMLASYQNSQQQHPENRPLHD